MSGSASQPYLRDGLWQHRHNDPPETADLAVAVAHQVAQAVMSVAGPLFWAALVVGLVAGALGISFGR